MINIVVLATEVLFFANDKMTVKEEYLDFAMSEKLPEGLLDVGNFKSKEW